MKKKDSQEVKTDKQKDETIMYQPIQKPKNKNSKEKKTTNKQKKKHPKLKLFLKVMLVMIILTIVIVGGIFSAILYRCIWGDWALNEDEITIKYENTTVFDKNGKVVAMLSGSENREIISKEEMSPYLFKAFISIEDERFEIHNGVDWYRTLGAFATYITHKGESSFGGSTITQQVVKNLTDEKDDKGLAGALRKIKEITRAYQVENILSKDQILELYLNLIPLGRDVYGVQTASRYYFNKNAKDLSIVEAAYLAGITSAPSTYNPFSEKDNKERIHNKVRTVLKKMYELGKIETEEEYNNALATVDAGIHFEKGEVSQNNKLNYYLDAARKEVLRDLMAQNNWSEKEAETHLYAGGYSIHTAFDPEVQAQVDVQFVDNAKNWYKIITVKEKDAEGKEVKKEVQRQGAMAIIDNETGYVVAGAGSLGEKTAGGLNRMIIKGHSPGSCMKPIGVIAPSLEEKVITAASVIDDIQTSFGSYKPSNWYRGGFRGLMNIREMLASSANVPEVILLKELTVPKALSYLDKMGVDVTAENDVGLSLALGGMTNRNYCSRTCSSL